MHLGKRNVRSAGRQSGSVELTLPVELSILEGIACYLDLRDGISPEIVLRPDLNSAVPVFEKIWELLALGLEKVGAIEDFAEADYRLALFHSAKLGPSPPLAYADALAINRYRVAGGEAPPQVLEAFARIVESMAAVAGERLGLSNELAALFGNQVAYLISGETLGARDAFARGLALHSTGQAKSVELCRSVPLTTEHWRRAQTGLARAYDQFATWNNDPAVYAKERELWYRAHHFEIRLGAQLT
jgi:hypothetical protein